MGVHEVLGELVAKVFTSGLPVDKELTLFYTVSYPVESRVRRLRTFLLYGIIRNSGNTRVVCLHGCGRLGMTRLILGDMNGNCLFSIEEECPEF